MSSEVGSGHVSIFPTMPGFRSIVQRETRAAGAAGAKTFEGGFKGAGVATGRALGRDLKSALNSSASDLGADAMRKLNAEVASASAALSKTRLKQQDEAGRVRVAETRLQEAIERSGASSSQAVAAEERLAAARRNQLLSTEAVSAATNRLKAAQDAVSAATQGARSAAAALAMEAAAGGRGLSALAANLRAGWQDAGAAKSAFTGVAGSIGGIIRAVSDLSGLTRLGTIAKTTAARVSTAFTTLATQVGGKLASGLSKSMSAVGSTVRGAFGPLAGYLSAQATILASPFVKLGSRVSTWMSPFTSQVRAGFAKISGIGGPAASQLVSAFSAGLSRLGSAASSAFSSVVGAAGRAASAAGQALGSGIQSAATGAVTVAAAGIGIAFGKGFARLTAIDTAQAKLRGLGNEAESVKTIMGDAMSSVRGTAFGLGEAATVAASAVAAGIKPGEALQGHLKSIANNASAAGISMEEMGSIFNKAATQANGVQNDVISQLADRGIPIYQALADQMGVTAGEVFDMASRGEIDFATFSKAAESAAGTVASEMGKTVPGAAKNFLAAMGRIGANALEPIYSKIGPLIAAATSALGPIEERAKAFGDVLLRVLGPALDWVTNLFTKIGEGASLADVGLGGLSGLLAPLGAAFAALGAGGLAGVLSRLPLVGSMLGGLTGPLAALGGPLGIVAAGLAGLALSGGDFSSLASGITGVVDQIVAALPGLIDQVVALVPGIISGIVSAIPQLLTAAGTIVESLIAGIVQAVPLLVDGALALVNGLIDAVLSNLPMIIDAAIGLVTTLIEGIISAVPMLVEAAITLVTGLLTAIIGALPQIIQGGIELLMALIQGIIEALPLLLQAALDLVTGLLTAIIENLPMIIEAGIQLLLSLITGLIEALPQLITAAIELVLQLVAGLLTMLPQLIEAGIQLVVSLITGLIEAIPQIIEMIPQIVEAIWNGLANVDWLDLGAQIIQGIIDGFFSMVDSLGSAVGDIVETITDFFPHSPAKRGPLSGSGWRRLKESGAATLEQFNAGAKDEAPGFGDALVEAASSASKRAQIAMTSASATVDESVAARRPGGPGDEPGAAAPQFVQNNHIAHMPPEEAVEMTGQRFTSLARRARV
ncbi:tape measure protein [uncultured Microbacterium sp.]|uniref:phage tail protein n=1 Tax=uncultured Microbacterium sp. TaxID=191216 RepID=UPI0025FF92F0|nr:tape measure protein [uncultured Microbacterium sp.]